MGLKIYTKADPNSALSTGGVFTNPLALTFDGVNGGVIEKRVYLRNDVDGNSYADIVVTPDHGTGQDIISGADGYSWKLHAGDQRPLEEQWSMVVAGEGIELPDISDTTTYLPFWIRIEIPTGAPVESFQTAFLSIVAEETV